MDGLLIGLVNWRWTLWDIYWFTDDTHLMWLCHDDVIKWKHFSCYLPFVRGIHRSPVISTHKGQWRRALKFPLICAWTNSWVNNCEAGDLRRHHAHYDLTVMWWVMWWQTGYGHIQIYIVPSMVKTWYDISLCKITCLCWDRNERKCQQLMTVLF